MPGAEEQLFPTGIYYIFIIDLFGDMFRTFIQRIHKLWELIYRPGDWSFVFYHFKDTEAYGLDRLHFGDLFYYSILFSAAQSAPIFVPSHRYPPRVYLLLFWCVFPATTVHSDGTPHYPSTLYNAVDFINE